MLTTEILAQLERILTSAIQCGGLKQNSSQLYSVNSLTWILKNPEHASTLMCYLGTKASVEQAFENNLRSEISQRLQKLKLFDLD